MPEWFAWRLEQRVVQPNPEEVRLKMLMLATNGTPLETGCGNPAAPSPTVPLPVYEATRSLLSIKFASEAIAILIDLVDKLGGQVIGDDTPADTKTIVEARMSRNHQFRACAEDGTSALLELQEYLPQLVEDAKRILALATGAEQLARKAGIDPLTGLPDHHSMSRIFSRLRPGDVVMIVELIDYSVLSDSRVEQYLDDVTCSFARVLRQSVRETDHLARAPQGHAFLIVLGGAEVQAAEALMRRVRAVWTSVRVGGVGFAAGIAPTSAGGWRPTVRAAERALWNVKQSRMPDGWAIAGEEDYRMSEDEGSLLNEPRTA